MKTFSKIPPTVDQLNEKFLTLQELCGFENPVTIKYVNGVLPDVIVELSYKNDDSKPSFHLGLREALAYIIYECAYHSHEHDEGVILLYQHLADIFRTWLVDKFAVVGVFSNNRINARFAAVLSCDIPEHEITEEYVSQIVKEAPNNLVYSTTTPYAYSFDVDQVFVTYGMLMSSLFLDVAVGKSQKDATDNVQIVVDNSLDDKADYVKNVRLMD